MAHSDRQLEVCVVCVCVLCAPVCVWVGGCVREWWAVAHLDRLQEVSVCVVYVVCLCV